MNLIIIDAGGTKTLGKVVLNNCVVRQITRGPGNLNEYRLVGWKNIKEIIKQLRIEYMTIVFERIVLGISGLNENDDYQKEFKKLRAWCKGVEVIVVDDIAMRIYTKGIERDSVLICAGTGSAIGVYWKGVYEPIGGYGYLFDELGSAFDFGKEFISKAIDEFENFSDEGFAKYVYHFFNINNMRKMIELIYSGSHPKHNITAFTDYVVKSDFIKSDECYNLLALIATKLFRRVRSLILKFNFWEFDFYLFGGMFNNDSYRLIWIDLINQFFENMNKQLPKINFIE